MARREGLVYFTVGGDPEYAALLSYCINTIRCHADNRARYAILVLCDEAYAPHVRGLPVDFLVLTEPNADAAAASARKLDVFRFPRLREFEAVLYLDCDVVVCGSLAPLFAAVRAAAAAGAADGSEPLLHAVPESRDPGAHRLARFFASRPYDDATLAAFAREGVLAFNCGQFAFRPTPAVERAFAAVREDMAAAYDRTLHLYEQPFVNRHFNERRAAAYGALAPFVRLIRAGEGAAGADRPRAYGVVNHFFDHGVPWREKLRQMRACHAARLRIDPPARVGSRLQLAEALALPPGPRVLELGTFAGDYAQYLLDALRPSALYLVDPWPAGAIVASGDQDGNHAVAREGGALAAAVARRFEAAAARGQVALLRKASHELTDADVAPGSLDLAYVDGEHSYEAVARDLRIAWRLLRHGGALCGHDYAVNPAKTAHAYPEFGVGRAVDELCVERGVRVWALFEDGCVSFCVLV